MSRMVTMIAMGAALVANVSFAQAVRTGRTGAVRSGAKAGVVKGAAVSRTGAARAVGAMRGSAVGALNTTSSADAIESYLEEDAATTPTTLGGTVEDIQANMRAQVASAVASDPTLAALNASYENAQMTATDMDMQAEEELENFVYYTVPSWTCGDECAKQVTTVFNVGIQETSDEVAQGELVSVIDIFAGGLRAEGIFEDVAGACATEIPSLSSIN